jgi:hypothetical protein
VDEQNILRLEICVDQIQIVQDWTELAFVETARTWRRTGYTGEQLSSKALDLRTRERHETVAFEEIKNTLSQ